MTRIVLASFAVLAMLALAGTGPAMAQTNNLKQLSFPVLPPTPPASGAAKIEVPNLKLQQGMAATRGGATAAPSSTSSGPEWKYVPVRR